MTTLLALVVLAFGWLALRFVALPLWRTRRLPPKTALQLRAEIEALQSEARKLHAAKGPEPEMFLVKNLATGRVEQFLGSAPCVELHHGEPTETVRPLGMPGPLGFFPATVGDLARDPAEKGFAPGEPVRYWAPASAGAPIEFGVQALHLYEMGPPPPPAA